MSLLDLHAIFDSRSHQTFALKWHRMKAIHISSNGVVSRSRKVRNNLLRAHSKPNPPHYARNENTRQKLDASGKLPTMKTRERFITKWQTERVWCQNILLCRASGPGILEASSVAPAAAPLQQPQRRRPRGRGTATAPARGLRGDLAFSISHLP